MDCFIVKCLFYIICLCLLKGYETSPMLTVSLNDVFVDSNITLTCSTSTLPFAVAWYKTDKGSTTEDKVIAQQWQNEKPSCQTENTDMECFCSSSLSYSCSIKYIKATNDGQSWRCKAYYGNEFIESNVFILKILLPLTSLTILPATHFAYPVSNIVSNFTCITSMSRPAATIQWFNDIGNITNLTTYLYNDDGAKSVLQYTWTDHGYSVDYLSCVASYEFKSIRNILTANISIRVQFPVSEPIVTINNLSTSTAFAIREGRHVHFKCSSFGYPQPSYNWTYPNGRSSGSLLNITFARNNSNVTCKAFNVMQTLDGTTSAQHTEKIRALNINVLYPPIITNVFYKGKHAEIIESTIKILRGDNINIVCKSVANPPASVFWHGQPINASTLEVTSVQHDTVWSCQATNSMTEFDNTTSIASVTRNVSARVLYGPGVPTITYTIPPNSDTRVNAANESVKIIEGSTIILLCSVDSVPISTYSWYPGHEGSTRTIVNVTRTTNTIYTCTAKNFMNTSFRETVIGSNYSSANLDILYVPANIEVKYNNVTLFERELKVIEGWSFTILCSVTSNPTSRYSWFGPVDGDGEVLFIQNMRTNMNRSVTCRADNTMVDSVGKSVIGETHVTFSLDVLYSPKVQRLQNQTVLLNTSRTVVCNLTDVGNPPASNFSWIRKDIGRVVGTGKTLIINNIRLTDEGEYQCNASNRMQPITNEVLYGLSQSTVYVNVEYGAYVREFKSNQSHNSIAVNQGETVDLLCDADGDPEPVLRVIKTTRGYESILVEIKGRAAKYRIQQAQCEYDTGNYTCLADNRYNEGRQLFALLVYCVPRASPFSLPTTTLSSAPNDSVLFTFTIIAYPKPTSQDVIWYKRENDSWRVLSDDNNFLITLSDDSMQTQLNIFHVQREDYRDYMVNVSNKLGSTMEVFTLKAQSKPEIPKESQISRIGKTELIVEWIPGFNGGENQTFTIRYKVLGDGSWIIIPINVSKHIWTIDGLASGITYQIQIRAQNKIGESDWTQAINITTLVDAVDKGSSSAIGGSIGGAAGVVLIVAVIVVIWRHRIKGLNATHQCLVNRNSVGRYEDLVREQGNNDTSTTDGSYETCRIDSSHVRHTNQYETLEELECRQYLRISACISQQVNTSSAKISASCQTDESANNPEYVNLQLFTQ
ncbi:neural cell adhesion molecule 2-like [Dreissena polymorpha]|uniref:neural cell adhesion molecule 2-like n=1 Tax=Dreissena polymorpha TaxID=45954 RepID=UPI0022645697|nr:neural cell adhesion molecule 2-like [Dreissena polymorpha]